MTSNQIAFRNYEETVRHNREMERLTGEQQAEVAQHNRQTEFVAAIEVGEKQRSNRANEALESQRNTINDTHYRRQDALTGFKYGTDAFVQLYPIQAGQVEASVDKTKAETSKLQSDKLLTDEKAKTESYTRGLTIAETFLTNAKTKTQNATTNNILFDNALKQAQIEKINAEIDLMYPNSAAERFQQYTSGAKNIANTVESGSKTVSNIINQVKTVTTMIPKTNPVSYVKSILLD